MRRKVKECSDEKIIDVSDVHVFGKFNAFKTRLIKV
jgi:hypothetical protein